MPKNILFIYGWNGNHCQKRYVLDVVLINIGTGHNRIIGKRKWRRLYFERQTFESGKRSLAAIFKVEEAGFEYTCAGCYVAG